jgi:hypothetical protein
MPLIWPKTYFELKQLRGNKDKQSSLPSLRYLKAGYIFIEVPFLSRQEEKKLVHQLQL